MKYQRNRFEAIVQDSNTNSKAFLQEEFKSILESNKPYASKCDYIGYSILSIDEKIGVLDEEMTYLKEYKSKLQQAKQTVQEVGASVFNSYGISKLEGGGISSITTTEETTKKKLIMTTIDEKKLIEAGFYKKVLDKEMVLESYKSGEYLELIQSCVEIKEVEEVVPAKLRINKRRAMNNPLPYEVQEEVAS